LGPVAGNNAAHSAISIAAAIVNKFHIKENYDGRRTETVRS
jgi:hypothetical protein